MLFAKPDWEISQFFLLNPSAIVFFLISSHLWHTNTALSLGWGLQGVGWKVNLEVPVIAIVRNSRLFVMLSYSHTFRRRQNKPVTGNNVTYAINNINTLFQAKLQNCSNL